MVFFFFSLRTHRRADDSTMYQPTAATLLVFVASMSASSASAAEVTSGFYSSCFVPAAARAAAMPPAHPHASSPMWITTSQLRLSMSSSNLDRKSRKFSRDPTTRIPRRQEEAVGITTSLGLWRVSSRMGQLLKEKWNSLLMNWSGRRWRKLPSRFNSYLLRDDSSSSSYSPRKDDDSALEEEAGLILEDDDNNHTSLDDMHARPGALQIRIRLRQESLSLERLMTEVRLELRRMEWKNVFDANAGSSKRTTQVRMCTLLHSSIRYI